jgi:hypothetical protein
MENQDPFWYLPFGILLIIIGYYKINRQLKRFKKEDKHFLERDDFRKIYWVLQLVGFWVLFLIMGVIFVLKYIL